MANRPNIQRPEQQPGQQPKQPQQQSSRGLAPRREFASPFGMLGRMMEDMDRVFGNFGFGRQQQTLSPFRGGASLWSPEIEVLEQNGKLMVRADLPGLEPKDVDVNIENDVLTLTGERKSEHEENKEGVYHCERTYGRFERSIALPPGVDPSSIDARFENGVLEISAPLPKQQERGRKIEVKSGSSGERKSMSH